MRRDPYHGLSAIRRLGPAIGHERIRMGSKASAFARSLPNLLVVGTGRQPNRRPLAPGAIDRRATALAYLPGPPGAAPVCRALRPGVLKPPRPLIEPGLRSLVPQAGWICGRVKSRISRTGDEPAVKQKSKEMANMFRHGATVGFQRDSGMCLLVSCRCPVAWSYRTKSLSSSGKGARGVLSGSS